MSASTTTLPLTGKIALVTGGSKGIGAAISTRLASLGATVIINYSSDSSSAETLLSTLNKTHPPTTTPPHQAIQADAASLPAIQSLVSTIIKTYSRIDILIPCAGILPMRNLESTTEQDFDRTFALNVKGPYFLCQAAVPHMPSGGKIILFSTSLTLASTVQPTYLLYNATKGAIEQMTRVMAKDLAGKGITVNCTAPGPTGTELFLRGKSEQMIEGIGKLSPFGRIGVPEEIADAVVLLCGEGSRWISGQVLRVNGAMA